MVKVILCALLILPACGGGKDSPHPDAAGGMDAPAGDATPPSMDVQGTGTLHFVSDTGVTDVPADFSSTTLTSLTPNGTGFDLRTGTGMADGTFVVPVGQGAASWDIGFVSFSGAPTEYLVGNAASLDFSSFVLGRPDAIFPMAATQVTINATGLSPWGADDDLEIMASNAGAIVFSPQASFATPPKANDVAIVGQTIDWQQQFVPLVDAAKGDVTMLFQLVTKTSGADSYAALAKLGTAADYTQTDGQASTMTVALADVAQDETLAVHWKRSQFAALLAQGGPGATAGFSALAVDALPDAKDRGFFGQGAPDLVEFVSPPAGTTDLDETFTYGNPFATGGTAWDEFVIVYGQCDVAVKASNAAQTTLSACYYGNLPVSALAADGTIAPSIGGVSGIQVGGKDVTTTAQAGVGLTPTITWDAPQLGTATSYGVAIYAVTASNGATRTRELAFFNTKDTSIQLPEGLLLDGGSFVATVTAYNVPSWKATEVPFEMGLPYEGFTTVTAQFQP